MKDNEVNLLQKIVVIVPEFQQWTGTRAMREIDFALGTNGRLPPKEVAKSLGLKAIIDPETLRVFDRLKPAGVPRREVFIRLGSSHRQG